MVKKIDDATRRARNRKRMQWQEQIARDPALRRQAVAHRLAKYIVQRYHADYDYAEFSTNSAAVALDLNPRQVSRAKRLFVDLGWIVLIEEYDSRRPYWNANRYRLGGGPNDLLIDEHKSPDSTDSGDEGEGMP